MDNNSRFSMNGQQADKEGTPLDARHRAAKKALNERFDELNKLWQTAEAELKQIPLPVNASVVIGYDYSDDPQHPEPTFENRLGFVKSKGGWRLCYGVTPLYYDDETHWTPIVECTLDLRLSAVAHLSKLRENVIEAAEGSIPKIDDAIEQLKSALVRK